ncbi:MAG TPA: M56 family metallopeptidase [Rhizomicrobium sp.]|nr:M56 family metallopeptidase [Rhizomicrobium sp.]
MTSPISWLSPAMMHALGWALIHFLWQGAAIAALAAILMRFCRDPRARYCVGVGALTLMLAMPFVTLLLFDGSALPAMPINLSVTLPSLPALPDILPWVVVFWFGGVALLSLRFAGGFLLLEQTRRHQSTTPGARVLALCREVQQRLGITRTIRYLECGWLRVPAVIGCIRPVVLLPVAALTGLTEAQLRAVIAHELAHVRRWDFLVNLFQILAETLFFYHPALWWLNRRISAERELCCDEIAMSEIGNRIEYADALVQIAKLGNASGLAMAATHGILSERIFHILGRPMAKPRIAGLAGSLFLLMASMAAGNALLVLAAPLPALHARENTGAIASPLITALAGVSARPQRESLPVGEAPPATTARDNEYVIPRRNRLALIRTIRLSPVSFLSMSLVMAPVDLDSPPAPDDQPVAPADASTHTRSVVAEELDALALSNTEYPGPVLKLNASHSMDEWTSGEAMAYCKDYATQTVTQGANRPMLVDDSFKQRLYYFYWQCMRSNINGVIQAYGGDWATSPGYIAVGTASSDRPVNLAGSWAISVPASAQPNIEGMLALRAQAQSCTFSQSGNTFSGTCTGREGSGAATGVVDGRQVRWSWRFPSVRSEAEYDFIAMMGPDGAMTGQSIMVKDIYSRALETFTATPGPTQIASQK